jgi:hypothetical protein
MCVLISLNEVIVPQCIIVSKHQVVFPKYIKYLFVWPPQYGARCGIFTCTTSYLGGRDQEARGPG